AWRGLAVRDTYRAVVAPYGQASAVWVIGSAGPAVPCIDRRPAPRHLGRATRSGSLAASATGHPRVCCLQPGRPSVRAPSAGITHRSVLPLPDITIDLPRRTRPMPETPTDTDVVVIGAGCAGLGAAAALRRQGVRAMVLEAGGRIGGRAWTAHPEALGGAWFDMGAVWLHWAERNPLVAIAGAAGETLMRSDELRRERVFVGTRQATPAEYANYHDAWTRF